MTPAAAPGGVTFSIRDLVVTLPDPARPFRLEVPALTIAGGERIGVVGPSGSGKSTLLDLLGLTLVPDSAGQFLIAGHEALALSPPARRSLRRGLLASSPQPDSLLPFLTLGQNIALGNRLATPGDDVLATVVEALGLAPHLGKRPAALSGGQRRRGALARALVRRAPLLIADEPTADLDQALSRIVRDLLRACPATIVIATHDPVLIDGGFDRILRLDADEAVSHVREGPP